MAEQIIIEFVGDSTQLVPSIEILEKLGQIDAEAAAAFKHTNAELLKRAEASKKVVAEEQKQIQTLNHLKDAVEALADATTAAVKETTADAFAAAGVAVEDFTDRTNVARMAQEKLKAELTAAARETPYSKLVKEINTVNASLLDTATRMQNLRKNGGVDTEGYRRLAQSLEEDKVKAKALDAQLQAVRESVRLSGDAFAAATGDVDEFTAKLEAARAAQATLKANLQKSTAASPFGKLQSEISDVNERLLNTATRLQALRRNGGVDTEAFQRLSQVLEDDKAKAAALASQLTAIQDSVRATDGNELEPLGDGAEAAAEKTKSLRGQISQLREQMALLALQGKKNSAEYVALEVQAGELKDAIGDANEEMSRSGSDTKNMDNVIQLAGGVAGAYAAAEGAAGLFGTENEFVQESLLKVNSAMALFQGLQQMGDVMSKRQFASLGALIGMRQADAAANLEHAVATEVNTVAQAVQAETAIVNAEAAATQAAAAEAGAVAAITQAEATVATTTATQGATVATRVWNTVLKANPLFLLLGVVVAVAAAVKLFTSRTTEASAAQEALNDTRERATDAIATEEAALNNLLVSARNENLSREQRQLAFDQLRQNYPEYLANLNAENIGTREVSAAIDRQIDLIKKRAMAQAAAEVYKDKLKEQIAAQNEVNKTIEEGAGFWESAWAMLKNGGNAAAANMSVISSKVDDVHDATKGANGAFQIMNQMQRELSESSTSAASKIQEQIEQLDKASVSASGFSKSLYDAQRAALQFMLAAAKQNEPFNTEVYENEKKKALAIAQARVDAARNGSIVEHNARRAMAKAEYDQTVRDARLSGEEKEAAHSKYLNDIEGLDIEARERNYRNAVAAFEATAVAEEAFGRIGSEGYYKAKAAALRKAAEQARAQEGITAGEIFRINAQLRLDLENLDVEKRGRFLQAQKDTIDAALSLVKQGSAQELALRMEQALIDRDQQLNQLGLTAEARARIEADYLRRVSDMRKQYDHQATVDALTAKQSEVNARLAQLDIAGAEETNGERVRLRRDAIELQALLEAENARNSITDEEVLQARMREIWTKAAADKAAIDRQAHFQIMDQARAYANAATDNAIKDEQLKLSKLGPFQLGARRKALQEIRDLELAKIDGELRDNDEKRKKDLANKALYDQKELELNGRKKDMELQQEQEHQQRKQEIITAGLGIVQQISDAMFETAAQDRQQRLDAELKDLDARKQSELNAKNLTEQQKADIEARYKAKERQIRLKAFEDEKEAKKQQALINGALAVTNILATMPKFDFGIASAIAIAAALSTTAIQVAKINSSKPPAFARGTRYAPRGYAWVGEEGPELVQLSGGEKIWSYTHSQRVATAWEDGRPGTPDDVLVGSLPRAVDPEILSSTYINAGGELVIDYDRLGQAVAKYIPEPVQNNINIDKGGLDHYVQSAGTRTRIMNSRYKISK